MATTSPFKQQCPGCGTAILIKDPKNIGKRAACPKCNNKFVIEGPAAEEIPIGVVEETPKPVAKTQPAAKPAPKPAAKPAAKPDDDEPIEAEVDEPAPRGFSGFKTTCPSCDAPITIKDPAQVNKKIECPRCKYRFQVEPPTGGGGGAAEEGAPTPEPAKKKRRARFDDEEDKPKPKVASNNLVLILGVGLSLVALGLLGVGGYFILFHGQQDPDSTRTTQFVQTTRPIVQTKPTTDTKGVEDGPALVEITNLLPNDCDLVGHIHYKDLHNSIVGRAAFNSPGTFKAEPIGKDLGLPLDEIDALAFGVRTAKGTGLAAVRTTKDVDLEKLKAALGLEPASDSPYKRQEYFLTRPSPWLANLQRIDNDAKSAGKPIQLAVRAVDKRTLVIGDPGTLKEFLEVNGQFKSLTPADPKSASNRFLTSLPELKGLLDRIDVPPTPQARPPMISVACTQEGQVLFVKSLEAQAQARIPALVQAFLQGSNSLGLAVNLHDGVVVAIAGDLKDPALANKIDAELMTLSERFARFGGLRTMMNGKSFIPEKTPPGPLFVKQLSFRTTLSGTRSVLETRVDLATPGNQALFTYILQPFMQAMRGVTEMAEPRPRIFDLGAAVQAYGKKHQRLPRGTLPRPAGKFGTTTPPDQRLSWLVELLPFLGYDEVYKNMKLSGSWRPEYDLTAKPPRLTDENARMANVLVPAFLDPETSHLDWWVTLASVPNYRCAATQFVGVAGLGLESADLPKDDPTVANRLGAFGYDRDTMLADIKDGPAATIAVLQVPPTYRRPWIAGGGATVVGVPETGSIKPFVCTERDVLGKRVKGTYAIMADGTVRFIPETIADEAFKALCTIAGGEKVDLDKETILVPAPSGKSELKTVTQN